MIGELAGKLKFLISTLLNEIQDDSQNGVHFGWIFNITERHKSQNINPILQSARYSKWGIHKNPCTTVGLVKSQMNPSFQGICIVPTIDSATFLCKSIWISSCPTIELSLIPVKKGTYLRLGCKLCEIVLPSLEFMSLCLLISNRFWRLLQVQQVSLSVKKGHKMTTL